MLAKWKDTSKVTINDIQIYLWCTGSTYGYNYTLCVELFDFVRRHQGRCNRIEENATAVRNRLYLMLITLKIVF